MAPRTGPPYGRNQAACATGHPSNPPHNQPPRLGAVSTAAGQKITPLKPDGAGRVAVSGRPTSCHFLSHDVTQC